MQNGVDADGIAAGGSTAELRVGVNIFLWYPRVQVTTKNIYRSPLQQTKFRYQSRRYGIAQRQFPDFEEFTGG